VREQNYSPIFIVFKGARELPSVGCSSFASFSCADFCSAELHFVPVPSNLHCPVKKPNPFYFQFIPIVSVWSSVFLHLLPTRLYPPKHNTLQYQIPQILSFRYLQKNRCFPGKCSGLMVAQSLIVEAPNINNLVLCNAYGRVKIWDKVVRRVMFLVFTPQRVVGCMG